MGRRAPHNGMVEIGCCTPLFGPWLSSYRRGVDDMAKQGPNARLVHEPLGVQLKLDAPSSLSHLVTFFSSGVPRALVWPGVPWTGSSSQTSPSPVQVTSKPGTRNRHRPLIRPCGARNAASMAKLGGEQWGPHAGVSPIGNASGDAYQKAPKAPSEGSSLARLLAPVLG
ncbi:hypothetical protein PG996_000344 [Apiospora saccharicola]|uniref:Uncharacterized protein n=1 Tax=Apiospora saccharicola TaxID=335842 RepID=A0ABR1WDR0_9PEZI